GHNFAPAAAAPLPTAARVFHAAAPMAPPQAAFDSGAARPVNEQQALYARMRSAFANGQSAEGELGVDVALEVNALRTECRVTGKVTRQALGRTLVNVGGAWVDDHYDAKLT